MTRAAKRPAPRAKEEPQQRPFTTDYGTTKGHCATKEAAGACAFNKLFRQGLKHVTIEGPNGKALCRIRRDSFWGIFIEPVGGRGYHVTESGPAHLRKVKG